VPPPRSQGMFYAVHEYRSHWTNAGIETLTSGRNSCSKPTLHHVGSTLYTVSSCVKHTRGLHLLNSTKSWQPEGSVRWSQCGYALFQVATTRTQRRKNVTAFHEHDDAENFGGEYHDLKNLRKYYVIINSPIRLSRSSIVKAA
jgi:hypothetical protein